LSKKIRRSWKKTFIPPWKSPLSCHCGINGIFDQFYKANSWASVFFPNKFLHTPACKENRKSWIKSLTEKSLNNKFGDSLDNFLMNRTAKSWNAKTQSNKTDDKGMLMSMHVGKHFSKPNPEIFQKKNT